MKEIRITGHLCIFDNDLYTGNLGVSIRSNGYKALVYTAGAYRNKVYARILIDAPAHLEVDHINGNSLDNLLSNLRLATSQQNSFNRKARKSKTGLPKGVRKNGSWYTATISFNYTNHYLGTFNTADEAEKAYLAKAEEYQKEFAVHNRVHS